MPERLALGLGQVRIAGQCLDQLAEAQRDEVLPVLVLGHDSPSLAPGRVPKATRRAQREVSLIVHDRIAHIGVPVVVLREKDGRAEVYGLSPPLAEDSALYLDATHMLVVVRRPDRWNDLVGD